LEKSALLWIFWIPRLFQAEKKGLANWHIKKLISTSKHSINRQKKFKAKLLNFAYFHRK